MLCFSPASANLREGRREGNGKALNGEKFAANGFCWGVKCECRCSADREGVAANSMASAASLAWSVPVSGFALLRRRRQAAALQDGLGLFCLAGVFEGYFVDAAEV
jgi:hypothetical protein